MLAELGEPGYVVVGDADPTTMARLAVELRAGSIEGAVLLTELSIDRIRLAREVSPRHLVLDEPDECLVDELGSLGWTQLDRLERRVVLAPPALSSTVRLVSRKEFAVGIDGSEPLATEVNAESVRLDDEALFGVFASSKLGGSCALLSLSGDGLSGDGTLQLRNPAALGLERADSHPDSLSVRANAGSVVCTAIGLAAGAPEAWFESEESEGWPGIDGTEAVRQLVSSPERADRSFWMVLQLRAPMIDPPVWMPAGQIFEQQLRTGRQTLATTAPVGAVVAPGNTTTLAVPTFCLDPHLNSPAGDPMRLTPLRVRADEGTTQEAAWRARRVARESDR